MLGHSQAHAQPTDKRFCGERGGGCSTTPENHNQANRSGFQSRAQCCSEHKQLLPSLTLPPQSAYIPLYILNTCVQKDDGETGSQGGASCMHWCVDAPCVVCASTCLSYNCLSCNLLTRLSASHAPCVHAPQAVISRQAFGRIMPQAMHQHLKIVLGNGAAPYVAAPLQYDIMGNVVDAVFVIGAQCGRCIVLAQIAVGGAPHQVGGGGGGTRPWWLALSACGGAYWPLTAWGLGVHPHRHHTTKPRIVCGSALWNSRGNA